MTCARMKIFLYLYPRNINLILVKCLPQEEPHRWKRLQCSAAAPSSWLQIPDPRAEPAELAAVGCLHHISAKLPMLIQGLIILQGGELS